MTKVQGNNIKFYRDSHLKDVELRYSSYRTNAFDKHAHESYSIGIILEGETEFYYRDKTHIIRKGEIALINPDEVHSCNPKQNSSLTYYMLYINPELILDISKELYKNLRGNPEFTDQIVRDEKLYKDLIEWCELFSNSQYDLETESLLYEIIGNILQKYADIVDRTEKDLQDSIYACETARNFLSNNIYMNIPLNNLADMSGLSSFYFLRKFREHFGLPPHAYQLQLRINEAKKMLAEGEQIASIALKTGFADQSHFTRKFKTLVGATPRQYQQSQDQS